MIMIIFLDWNLQPISYKYTGLHQNLTLEFIAGLEVIIISHIHAESQR